MHTAKPDGDGWQLDTRRRVHHRENGETTMAERLDQVEWVHHLPSIPIGGRRRYPHDCGEGKPLIVYHNEPEASAYCWRCGKVGYYERQMSAAEKLAMLERQKSADRKARQTVELPACTSTDPSDWPRDLRNWFYKMGIGPAHLEALGCFYSADMDRVVLPIRDDTGRVVSWTARSSWASPKWIGPSYDKVGLVVRFGVGRGDKVVLLEDPLSAYKVGLVCEAWCLLGTKLQDGVVLQLLHDPRQVVTWLDDDKGRAGGYNPGQEAAAAMRRRLVSLGKPVANLTSDRDPKYLPRQRLKEKLWTSAN